MGKFEAEASRIGNASARGGLYAIVGQATTFVVTLITTAILARELGPEAFGQIALAGTVIGLALLFSDLGLGAALVQRKSVTHEQVTVVYWIQALIGLILTGIVAAIAPAAGWFFDDPQVTWIILALSPTFFVGSLGGAHKALLLRRLRILQIRGSEIVAMVTGAVIAIILAKNGAGVWSLVVMTLVRTLLVLVSHWIFARWMPGWPKRGTGARSFTSFGLKLSGASFGNYLARRSDNFILGRVEGTVELGLYSRAYSLLLAPVRQINGPIGSVVMPALARVQDRPTIYRRYYHLAILGITSLGMPLVVLTLIHAEEVVDILLGDQWTEVVPIFRMLALATVLGTMNVAGGWVNTSMGRPGRSLRISLITGPIMAASFLVAAPIWGAIGVAAAVSISTAAFFVPTITYSYKDSPVGWKILGKAIWRPVVAVSVAGGLSFGYDQFTGNDNGFAPEFYASVAIFSAAYAAVWLLMPGGFSAARLYMDRIMNRERKPAPSTESVPAQ